MNINELIEKRISEHAPHRQERLASYRQFAIELLEMVKNQAQILRDKENENYARLMKQFDVDRDLPPKAPMKHCDGWAIDKALEELRK